MNDLYAWILLIAGIVCIVTSIMCIIDLTIAEEFPQIKLRVCLISASIVAFIAIGCVTAGNKPIIQDNTPYQTKYLYALEDNNFTTGRGYYRRVQIDTDLYYQFLYKDGSGYKNDRVKADITSIFEDDTTPRVEYYRTSQKWFIFEKTDTVIKLYVPKDTISGNYNIDLQ